MKNFWMSVLLAAGLLQAGSCFAADTPQPQPAPVESADEGLTFPQTVSNIIAVGKYFDEKYPDAAIDEDFSEDVAEKFPGLTTQQVFDREETIRFWIKAYRVGKAMYEAVKAKMLLPEEPPLIVPEDQYDLPKEREYIESDDMVVVEDFKKVLSYGSNPRDFEAYAAKLERDREKEGKKSDFAKLNGMLKKLEWKKLPFYGIIYDDPFTGKLGSGEWIKADGVEMRLIAEYSTVNDRKDIRAGIHFDLEKDWFVLAQNYKGFQKPRFSFEGSENLASAEYFYPVPLRLLADNGESAAVWQRNFMLPLQLRLKDASQPLKLKAGADFTLCSLQLECRPVHIDAELDLQAGEGFYSSVNNFIVQSFNFLPRDKTPVFSLEKAVVDETGQNGSQVLRLEFDADEELDNFDVYVEGSDNIAFRRPRLAVGDFGITARIEPQNPGQELAGKTFEITARLNNMTFLRKTVTVEKASVFDYRSGTLSLTLLLTAVLGGFILNFMPCVFPVLSLKLLSLTRFGAGRPENLRRNFIYTVLGVFAAFEVIALFLSLLKLAGHGIGWGMQFQNPGFLVVMIFAVAVFMSVVWGFVGVRSPQWLENRLSSAETREKLPHLLTGMLAVFMATPCTAPYLGTAVGFALAGTVADVWLVLNAVALGLSLPYLLVLAWPSLAAAFPKPGAWMERLNNIMGFMLFLTLLWLLSVLFAQAGFWPVFRLGLYLAVFLFVLYYRREALDAVDGSDFEPEIKTRVVRLYNRSILSVLFFIFAVAAVDVVTHFNRAQEERTAERAAYIDYDAISDKIRAGRTVVVAVGADWCLTCKYNEAVVFNNAIVENLLKNSNTELIEVDWTSYNPEVLAFMKKFGRQGLPFYVVFSPMVPDGMVMPEVLSERTLSKILRSISD